MQCDIELDTSGLLCPRPLLEAKQVLKKMQPGQVLKVISTDPSSVLDFKVFTATTGHVLLRQYEKNGQYYFFIKY